MTTATHSTRKHARLNASAAKRWLTCTAQPGYCAANPSLCDYSSSIYADDGTTQHEWNEKLYKGECTLAEVPDERREYAVAWVDHVRALESSYSIQFTEESVPLFYSTGENGTVDYASLHTDVLHVRDYKHGEGQYVGPDYNEQLAIYARSIIDMFRRDGIQKFPPEFKVTIGIVQPRHRQWEDKPWQTTVGELDDMCAEMLRTIAKIEANDVEFNPSDDACRWCPIKKNCKARREAALRPAPGIDLLGDLDGHIADLKIEQARPADAEHDVLTDEQAVLVYQRIKLIKSYVDGVEVYLEERAKAGSPAPGTKLVMGREGNRAYTDEEKVKAVCAMLKIPRSDYLETKLKGIAQLEKLDIVKNVLKKDPLFENPEDQILLPLITRAPASKVIALASDPRREVPAVDAAPAPEFTDLDATPASEPKKPKTRKTK